MPFSLSQALEHLQQMQLVLCMTLAENDNVLDLTPGKGPLILQCLIHDPLEEHQGILQTMQTPIELPTHTSHQGPRTRSY
jgi:hypothetical protein